jgi:hypothetical protein
MARFFKDAEHWRQRAEQARMVAEKFDDAMAKSLMLDIAERYDWLAEHVETASTARALQHFDHRLH